jgi:hypothetical protein
MEESMMKTGRPRRSQGAVFRRGNSQYWWVRYRDREGKIVKETSRTTDREEAERFLRDRLDARDEGRLAAILAGKSLTFSEWADWFLEKRSKPPYRAEKTHAVNVEVLKNLKPVFGTIRLRDITSEAIEQYLEQRLNSSRRIVTKLGIQYRGKLKPATVHREFRVIRRILNLAVKQKVLAVNPCQAVDFPVRLQGTTRKPHYMTASEQARIEFFSPSHLRNVVVIMAEMGLRPYKELLPMRKCQVDLENEVVHIPDSKTTGGIADMPMTPLAKKTFAAQMEEALDSEFLFPSPKPGRKPYLTTVRKAW